MLPLDAPPGSTYRLLYRGPVGVAGTNVKQTWDLSALPKYLRVLQTFRDDFRVFVRPLDEGVTAVSDSIEFGADLDGVVAGLTLTLTSAAVSSEVNIEAWFVHSAVR